MPTVQMILLPFRDLRERQPVVAIGAFALMLGVGLLGLRAVVFVVETGGGYPLIGLALLAPFHIMFFVLLRRDYRVFSRYRRATCTILSKTLQSGTVEMQDHEDDGSTRTRRAVHYRPVFDYAFEVRGRKRRGSAYDRRGGSSSSRTGQQKILDRYEVGSQYPCFYPPQNPAGAVLVRRSLWLHVFLLLPYSLVALTVVGGLGLLDSVLAIVHVGFRNGVRDDVARFDYRCFVAPRVRTLRSASSRARQRAATRLAAGLAPSHEPRLAADLVQLLADDDPETRRLAVDLLGLFGHDDRLESLHRALADRHPDVRAACAAALGSIGSARSIEPLVVALGDESDGVQRAADDALERIDTDWRGADGARSAAPALAKRVMNGPWGHARAVQTLGGIGDAGAVPGLLAALDDSTVAGHSSAVAFHTAVTVALGKIADPRALQPLIDRLEAGTDHRRRGAAAMALGHYGTPPAVEALIRALQDESATVRECAAEALGASGDVTAIVPLARVLTDEQRSVGQAARAALDRIDADWGKRSELQPLWTSFVLALAGPGHDLVEDALVSGCADWPRSNEAQAAVGWILAGEMSERAAAVLGRIGDRRAITALVETLPDANSRLRAAVREALDAIDPDWPRSNEAREAVPLLVENLGGYWGWAQLAAEALQRIGDPTAVEGLVAATIHRDARVRRAVKEALEATDPDWAGTPSAQRAASRLIEALNGHEPEVLVAAAETLAALRTDQAVPGLVATLTREEEEVRAAAERALSAIDPEWSESEAARTAIAELGGKLSDPNPEVRKLADDLLSRLDPNQERSAGVRASLPVHLSRLADRREGTRQAAAAALQRIDPEWAQRPEAVARIAELAVAATSMDAGVRTAALQHLDAIDPDWPRNEAARAAVLELTRALKDRIFRREKEAVAGMLGRMPVDWIKGPVTELIATGDHETRDVIGALLERLDLQGDDPESGAAVALLVEDLARTPVDLSLTRDTIDKLGNLGDKAAIGPLLKKAGCRHVELRPLIVDVLDQIDLDWAQSPEATALVPGMLHDLESALTHSTRVRFAVEMLGAMRVPEAVAPLLARLIENPLGLEPQLLVALESVDPEWTARPEARKAIPVLRRQSSEHAERALERLGAD